MCNIYMYNQIHAIGLEDEGTAMFETSRNTHQKKPRHVPKDLQAPTGVWLPTVMLQLLSSKLFFRCWFYGSPSWTEQDSLCTYNVTQRLVVAVEKQ